MLFHLVIWNWNSCASRVQIHIVYIFEQNFKIKHAVVDFYFLDNWQNIYPRAKLFDLLFWIEVLNLTAFGSYNSILLFCYLENLYPTKFRGHIWIKVIHYHWWHCYWHSTSWFVCVSFRTCCPSSSLLFPHRRIYMPAITKVDPATLLIADGDTLDAVESRNGGI